MQGYWHWNTGTIESKPDPAQREYLEKRRRKFCDGLRDFLVALEWPLAAPIEWQTLPKEGYLGGLTLC
jgi:hypothetical protein